MHGSMRMYSALGKKIIECSSSPAFTLRAAQYLNNKIALDSRDPNGFRGVGRGVIGSTSKAWASGQCG